MYTFCRMDTEVLQSTRIEWVRQLTAAKGQIMPAHFEGILDWVEKLISLGDDHQNQFAYCILKKEGNYASAVLEISHARPESNSPWLKLLSIHVEPRLDIAACNKETLPLADLAHIGSMALTESLQLTFDEHPSGQLKVYCGQALDLRFLEGVAAMMPRNLGFGFSTHGNWLVIDKAD